MTTTWCPECEVTFETPTCPSCGYEDRVEMKIDDDGTRRYDCGGHSTSEAVARIFAQVAVAVGLQDRLRSDKICSQCGKSLRDLPCGPTHAVIQNELMNLDLMLYGDIHFELVDGEVAPRRIGLAPACCCLVDRETGKTLELCTAHRRQRGRH